MTYHRRARHFSLVSSGTDIFDQTRILESRGTLAQKRESKGEKECLCKTTEIKEQ